MDLQTNKKELILKVSQDLFARFGLKKTTVEEIARFAHIGKGTIYHYFESKERIFAEVIEEEREFLKKKVWEAINREDSPQGKLRAFLLTKMKYLVQLANYYGSLRDKYLERYSVIEKARRESFEEELKMLRSILEEGVHQAIFTVENLSLTALAIVSSLRGLEYSLALGEGIWTEDNLEALLRVLLRGLERR